MISSAASELFCAIGKSTSDTLRVWASTAFASNKSHYKVSYHPKGRMRMTNHRSHYGRVHKRGRKSMCSCLSL